MDKAELPPGVSYEANRRIKKYKAVRRINGKLTHLGYFRTAEEARLAFEKAKDENDNKQNP